MSTDKCEECGVGTTSASERDAGLCLPCLVKLPARLGKTMDDLSTATGERDNLARLLAEAEVRIQKYQAMVKAEADGRIAGQRGAPATDNPYLADTDENVAWEKGWLDEDLSTNLRQLLSVLLWTTEHLAHVREVAAGYGQQEIVTKIDLVIQKVGPYLQELIA